MSAGNVSRSITSKKILLASASSVLALAAADPAYAKAKPVKVAPDAAMAAAAAAQPAGQTPATPAADQSNVNNSAQQIVVTGIRGSLQRDLNAKRAAAEGLPPYRGSSRRMFADRVWTSYPAHFTKLIVPKMLTWLVGAGRFERPTPCAQGMSVVSNGSISYYPFSMFPIRWGTCFPLKG